jgi:vacuolar-type H+-ATPase catalytic subunit A/Vma1
MSEQPIAFEEVPGSRTSQQAIDQPQRERIAYEELQPGDVIQEGDEWQTESGRWKPFASLDGSRVQVRHTQSKSRRPYKVSTILEIGDALADAQRAATQLQDERDELREALAAEQLTHKFTTISGLDACRDRDEALAEVAKLSAEVWARKPLEDRITSLVEELAQARAGGQQLLKTIAENADQFAEHTIKVVRECDEARAEVQRLQDVVSNLYSEPTARQVQDMLRTWATELDWAAGCFDSLGREQIDTIQKTLIAVMERIDMLNPEVNTDGE